MTARNQTHFTRRVADRLLDSGLPIARLPGPRLRVGYGTFLRCERVTEGSGVARMDKLMDGASIALLDGGRVRTNEHVVCMSFDFLIDVFHGTAVFPIGGYPVVTGRTGTVVRHTKHGVVYVVGLCNTLWAFMGAETLNRLTAGRA